MSDKKITVLIGAGASSPFIIKDKETLTTDYLTKSLINPNLWEIILQDFRKYHSEAKSSSIWNINKEDVLFVMERIQKFLFYKNTPNFENLLYFLDKVALNLYCSNDYPEGILPGFWCNNSSDIKKKAYSKSDTQGWKYIPFLAREVLIKAILDVWDPQDALIKEAIVSNNLFYKNLNERFKSLSIYSLNYDPLIYESIKDIPEIKICFSDTPYGFSKSDFFKTEKILAFLHGFIGFIPQQGEKMFLDSDYNNAQRRRMKNMFRNDMDQTRFFDINSKGLHYNTYFVSGLDKIDAFYSNPFACYMHRFSKDILESDYIVAIGTALNNDHLNLFLINTLSYSDKKIFLITKKEAELGKDLHHQNFFEDINKIWHKARANLTLPLNSFDKILPLHFKKLNKNLIDNGYGLITPNLVIFINGVEEFYKISNIDDFLNNAIANQKAL